MNFVVSNILLPFGESAEPAFRIACKTLGIGAADVQSWSVHKMSHDLRRGGLRSVWSIELGVADDFTPPRAADIRAVAPAVMPSPRGRDGLTGPPVVIGFGPAGLFSALILAENGYHPLVLERGGAIDERDRAVDRFFGGGELDKDTNIQFGEGGAGAYSDGKLTTRIGDARCALVLSLLKAHGAPAEALAAAKPHIGTDLLKDIVMSMRRRIIGLGGTVSFNCAVTGIDVSGGRLRSVSVSGQSIPADIAVLAVGHSARDTFKLLHSLDVAMRHKPFSCGVRIEHLQSDIDAALYNKYAGTPGLPAGEYALSQSVNGRGCYSFCMCPGGTVVAAASEHGGVVTNGMSFHARDGANANSALCVSVTPEDLDGSGIFAGIAFQQSLERAAFAAAGGYTAPVELLGDFLAGIKPHSRPQRVKPTYPVGYEIYNLRTLLPPFIGDTLAAAIPQFAKKLRGFDSRDAVLTGVETRTSSPLKIPRDDATLCSLGIDGLIPCGEGAGYAGGIMSAAVDGIRAAEAIMARYRPL